MQFSDFITGGSGQIAQAAMTGFPVRGFSDRLQGLLSGGPLDAPERMPAGAMQSRVGLITYFASVEPLVCVR